MPRAGGISGGGALAVLLGLGLGFAFGCGGQEVDLESPDPYARYLGLLDRVDGDRSEATVRIVLAKLQDPSFLVREGALTSLAKLNRPDLAPHAEPLLEDPEPLVREAACRTLGHYRFAPAASKLAARLGTDSSPAVRRAAAEGLGRLPATQGAARALLEGLSAKDASVRLACHDAIREASGLSHPIEAREAWEAWVGSVP
jgi:HEAT repeat protein